MPNVLPRRALPGPGAALPATSLGATQDFYHGLLDISPCVKLASHVTTSPLRRCLVAETETENADRLEVVAVDRLQRIAER